MTFGPVSLPVQGRITCDFTIVKVTKDAVALTDDALFKSTRSVTNAAEQVVEWLLPRFPNRRYFYCDAMGEWDELGHDGAKFTGFIPLRRAFSIQQMGR